MFTSEVILSALEACSYEFHQIVATPTDFVPRLTTIDFQRECHMVCHTNLASTLNKAFAHVHQAHLLHLDVHRNSDSLGLRVQFIVDDLAQARSNTFARFGTVSEGTWRVALWAW
jgi:hypothetical protein